LVLLEQEEPLQIRKGVVIESNLYVLKVSTEVMNILSQNKSYLIFDLQELQEFNILVFAMERKKFLSKVEMALSLSNEVTNN
jgi:hypothetical protein